MADRPPKKELKFSERPVDICPFGAIGWRVARMESSFPYSMWYWSWAVDHTPFGAFN
jgi:hypothetical protein